MIGWHITVYRTPAANSNAAASEVSEKARLAVWQANAGGLKWLDRLVKQGKARDLGGNGYPNQYSVRAGDLVPQIAEKPPDARDTWVCGPEDVITDEWEGKTVIDREAIANCPTDEWLLVEAWEES